MTTTTYIVAYPHPEVSRHKLIKRLRCGSDDDGDTLIDRLCDIYPGHRDDLKEATLWKVSRSIMAQLPSDQHHRPQVSLLRSWITNPKCQYTSGSRQEKKTSALTSTRFWKTAFLRVRNEG